MTLYYKFTLDTQRDASFTGYHNDITVYVKRFSCQSGAMGVYDPVASPAYMEMVLDNSQADFNLQDSNAKYYGKVQRGTLVKVQASLDGINWTTLSVLKIMQKIPSYTMAGDHELTLKATDILQGFFNQDFVAPLQTDVSIDEILDKLHLTRGALYPYESYYQFIGHTSIGDGKAPFYGADWTDFETAETALPFYGDNLDRGQGVKVQQYIKDAVSAEIFGLYWFSPRSERFKFLSRYHASDTAVSWNITTAITDAPKYTDGRDLTNDYALDYYPRAIGDANSVLFSSDNVPFQLPAKTTKRLTLKYRDPNQENATVGALEVNDIQMGVDIIANSLEDGSGTDWTQFIIATLIKGTSSSELILYNRKVGDPAYITTLQLRGTPLTAYNKETAYGYNDDSIYGQGSDESSGNDRAVGGETLYAVSDIDFAQDYADFKVNAYGQPIQAIEKLTIQIQEDDTTTQSQVLARSIGDVINFVDVDNGHDLDYMIVAEQHSVSPTTNPPMHTVTYTLRPSQRGLLFVLGESFSDEGASLSF